MLGWGLLAIGLLLIVWMLYSTYSIFTGKTEVPQVFKMEEKKDEVDVQPQTSFATPEEAQEEMQRLVEDQMKDMIPIGFISKILNLMSWSILAGIFIFGGGRISGIGLKLIKE